MIAKKASITNCRLELRFLSQFFQSLRHLSNQAKDLSTIHRLGKTLKVCNSLRLTTSTVAWSLCFTSLAKGARVYPPSTNTFSTPDNLQRSKAPFLSVTLAVVISIACGKPCVSCYMPLDTRYFLACVITFFLSTINILYTL